MPETEEPSPSSTAPTTAATAATAPPANTATESSKKKKKKRSWLPLESNPEVLSTYARALGAPALTSFADVYGLDDELLGMVPTPVLALLLLFPITKSYEDKRVEQEKELRKKQEGEKEGDKEASSMPYFTRQTIGNACGTVGLIHSFASIKNKVQESESKQVFEPGSFLERFYEATAAMTPDERAAFLEADEADEDEETKTQEKQKGSTQEGGRGDDEEDEAKKNDRETRAALAASIDAAHAAAANKGDTRPPGEDESVDLHFVAFVESGGRLWELDGLKVAPVDHGATTKDTLLKDAAGAITREFVQNETAEGSINFNLLALVGGGGGGVDE